MSSCAALSFSGPQLHRHGTGCTWLGPSHEHLTHSQETCSEDSGVASPAAQPQAFSLLGWLGEYKSMAWGALGWERSGCQNSLCRRLRPRPRSSTGTSVLLWPPQAFGSPSMAQSCLCWARRQRHRGCHGPDQAPSTACSQPTTLAQAAEHSFPCSPPQMGQLGGVSGGDAVRSMVALSPQELASTPCGLRQLCAALPAPLLSPLTPAVWAHEGPPGLRLGC